MATDKRVQEKNKKLRSTYKKKIVSILYLLAVLSLYVRTIISYYIISGSVSEKIGGRGDRVGDIDIDILTMSRN